MRATAALITRRSPPRLRPIIITESLGRDRNSARLTSQASNRPRPDLRAGFFHVEGPQMFTDFTDTLPPPRPARPPGTAEDWTIPQRWERFGAGGASRLGHAVRPPAPQARRPRRRRVRARARRAAPVALRNPRFRRSQRAAVRPLGLDGGGGARACCPTRSSSPISPAAASPPAISSAPPPASIISRSRTCSTTCSATCRCSPSPGSPISCSGSARKG